MVTRERVEELRRSIAMHRCLLDGSTAGGCGCCGRAMARERDYLDYIDHLHAELERLRGLIFGEGPLCEKKEDRE